MHRFGDVVVDPRAREVRRGGRLQHLEPQAFDLLVHLIERRDEVVSKHDLLDGVWGHRFVSEAALTTRIKEIRRAVGDDGATQHTIRNVRGRGYRFVAELSDDAHPLGAAPPTRGDAIALVGRAAEGASVRDRLSTSPLVTLVGPGGVGKSTLARSLMVELAGSHRDGVHLVELAPLASGDQVVPALARLLDTVLDVDHPERALAAIARLDALLVLDNCEHVVDDVAGAVDRLLLAPGSAVRVLATSQVRLGLAVEQVVALTPLTPDEAIELFTARVRAVRPEWDLDAGGGAERIGALLDQLDRLPLTIEMAAARLGSMTIDELEQAVADGGQIVQMTHRTPTRRHRTLGSMVEWSAGLLAPADRRVFVEFSVFAGAVGADDAARVLGADAPVAIGELVDRSLLAADVSGPAATYRMLDTVRTVARRWLAADPTQSHSVHRRHAESTLGAMEAIDRSLRSADEAAGRARLDTVVAEVRQAHRWAVEHAPELADRLSAALHLASYGRLWTEPATWSASLLARHGPDAAHRFPGAALVVAGAAANAGDLDAARRQADGVLAGTDDQRLQAIAHEILADVAIYAGQFEQCRRHTDELARLGDALGDAHVRVMAAVDESIRRTFSGSQELALEPLDALDTADVSPSSLAWIAYARGEVHSALGDHDAAIAAYEEAIEMAGSVRNPLVVSVGQSSLAAEHARAGSRREAYAVAADCLRGYLRHGNLVHAVTAVRNLVSLLHVDGDLRGAAVLAAATTRTDLRQSYGVESERLGGVLAEIESAVWPDRFRAWIDEGRALDVDAAVRRAAQIVQSHLA